MGIIQKTVRRSQNQKLAQPIRVTTSLSIDQVVAAAQAVCAEHNQQRQTEHEARVQRGQQGNRIQRWLVSGNEAIFKPDYYITVEPNRLLIGWLREPTAIMAISKPNAYAKYWLAEVTFPASEAPVQGQPVEVRLLQWIIDSNGHLQSKDHYATFCSQLFERIASSPR